jgi:hypothetical protein
MSLKNRHQYMIPLISLQYNNLINYEHGWQKN